MTKKEAIESLSLLRIFDAPDLNEAVKIAVAAIQSQTDTPPNDPLTLEQLRKMNGEPVYVRYLGGGGEWGIVETMYGYDHVEICLHRGLSSVGGKRGLFSKGAKIYRRKPEE